MTEPAVFTQQSAIAQTLRDNRQLIAVNANAEFFRCHPDWRERYGERGWQHGLADALFHVDFLAGAVEGGRVESFADYARWTSRMLAARGIAPGFVAESITQVGDAAGRLLSAADHAYVASYTSHGSAACRAVTTTTAEPTATATIATIAAAQALYLDATLNGRRQAATTIALETLRSHSLTDLYVGVLQESQAQLGRLWESNRISVAQEHLATAVTQFVLSQTYAQLPMAPATRGRMIVTGVVGEMHQLGANMIADVLESNGWDVRFLGTHLPHAGVLDAIAEHKADVVGISATMLFSLPNVRDLVEQARAQFGPSLRIVLGGAAFNRTPTIGDDQDAELLVGDLRVALAALCPPEKPGVTPPAVRLDAGARRVAEMAPRSSRR